MGNLTTPKRSDAAVSKLGTDPSKHQFQGRSLPTAQHRVTRNVSEVEPPAHLSKEVQEMWTEWTTSASWLAPSDLPALRYLCELMERRNKLLATASPGAASIANVEGLIARLMASMGFTPQSRIQLGLATVEAESKLEMFLSGDTGTDG